MKFSFKIQWHGVAMRESGKRAYLSGEMVGKSCLLEVLVWTRSEAVTVSIPSSTTTRAEMNLPVRTNCPTVAPKPDKNALNG